MSSNETIVHKFVKFCEKHNKMIGIFLDEKNSSKVCHQNSFLLNFTFSIHYTIVQNFLLLTLPDIKEAFRDTFVALAVYTTANCGTLTILNAV